MGKIRSAKQKGRVLQQWVASYLLDIAKVIAPDVDIQPDDIRSTPMGVNGTDVQLSTAARKLFNFDIECKNVEKLSIWQAIQQAKDNSSRGIPMVFMKKNRHEVWVALPADKFKELVYGIKEEEF